MGPRLAITILTLVALAACEAPLRPLASTVCHETRRASSSAGGESTEASEPTDADWIALLTDDEEGRPSSCEELLARTPPQEPVCTGARPRALGTLHPIAPRIVARLHREGEDDVLWVATHTTSEGLHVGPLALVRRTTLGLEVQAIGRHAGSADHAEARVLRTEDAVVVSIESELAGDRIADLLVRSGGALVPAALDDPDVGCQAPARIVLRRRDEQRADDGWTIRTVRTAVLDEDARSVVLREHLTVRELDAADPDAPPRATHDADGIRHLTPSGARLRADRGPLAPPPREEPAAPRHRRTRH
ncbi:hypothetical protein [Sandaracinus amylolyticus]|uniref:hypothetical protein n=1 Tax=Sandaracinus amylolyticus TaxID=927083 RepID=UPI001F17E63A|nr:hypothetical protein [Sandaracinus amylolyticus]UJR78608.1 Hypothetical protein I5071_6390 [Sandaracinus amylolyticus]